VSIRLCRFGVHRYMFGRVLNRGFVNPRVQRGTRDSLHKTLLSSLDRSKGSQRAPRKDESLVVRVNGCRSILNVSNAGREAETFFSSLNRPKGFQRALCGGKSLVIRVNGYYGILNAYNTGKEAI
jgi:hypothetical protein